MKNPVALNEAQKAARNLCQSQGGSYMEGGGGGGMGESNDTPKYTGHESAPSSGVASGVPKTK